MLFCGDTVWPFSRFDSHIWENLPADFLRHPKVVNLESLILADPANVERRARGIALHSTQQGLDFLKELNVVGVSLANNHILDYGVSLDKQKELLADNGIVGFGAGDSKESAQEPFIYAENESLFAVIACGWDVIGCCGVSSGRIGVNPFEYSAISSQVAKIKSKYTDIRIICSFHTNYEFELFPQPGHRRMFFQLIEEGVSAIICHHAHVVCGSEIYKGAPIFYGLGNFYLPETHYLGFKLDFPEKARRGLCVKLGMEAGDTLLFWTIKDREHRLSLENTELLSMSERLLGLTPYKNMSYGQYTQWFKNNRIKRNLLPIYYSIDSKIEQVLNYCWVRLRQYIIDTLLRLGLKKNKK